MDGTLGGLATSAMSVHLVTAGIRAAVELTVGSLVCRVGAADATARPMNDLLALVGGRPKQCHLFPSLLLLTTITIVCP